MSRIEGANTLLANKTFMQLEDGQHLQHMYIFFIIFLLNYRKRRLEN